VRTAAMESSCPLIKNILLLDSEGKRIAVKYYGTDWYPPCPSLSPPSFKLELAVVLSVVQTPETPSPQPPAKLPLLTRVSGRGHTPSWVHRRRLTGRLWNTTSCLR
jgi:hypothetical protein